jgi:hypothetical protein
MLKLKIIRELNAAKFEERMNRFNSLFTVKFTQTHCFFNHALDTEAYIAVIYYEVDANTPNMELYEQLGVDRIG